ncbi:hypothetical protein QCD85_19210 [Paenibacillus sp. PsM32]|uniref:hypothetical protein n=1 Tax=Paenibacillus sp. PsM32 TaxID=3030536 RepID=UPI00263AFC52|nr:hypothetical protein [Paenibacillus sp. PsM32]MDN4620252.1 hypothetical protein [Paenibacillus sp. PsM32]
MRIVQELLKFTDSESFRILISVVFLSGMYLIGVVYLVLSVKKDSADSKFMKMFGILTVLGLSVFVNNIIIYVLTIMILSTLITTTNYLENILKFTLNSRLVNLFPGNEAKRSKKNLDEVERVSATETDIMIPDPNIGSEFNSSETPIDELLSYSMSIESLIIDNLKNEIDQLKFESIQENLVLTRTKKKEFLLDAILEYSHQVVIVEVQPFISYNLIHKSIEQVKEQNSLYRKYLKENKIQKKVKNLLCTLDTNEISGNNIAGVLILKYNLLSNSFSNFEEIIRELESNE